MDQIQMVTEEEGTAGPEEEREQVEDAGLPEADPAEMATSAEIETFTETNVSAEADAPAEADVEAETDASTETETSAETETSGEEAASGPMGEMGELPVEDWDYQRPRRGQVRSGVILEIRAQEIIVDVGDKRDGIVPYTDIQRLSEEELAELSAGDEVPVFIMRPEDQDGNLLVSLHLAKQEKAWYRAKDMFEKGTSWEGEVIGYNKGGLVVPVDDIRGFVPASQVPGFPSGMNQEERLEQLASMVGETLRVKVIEINRHKRRLILSATRAQREWRKTQRERLLQDLREGEVRSGRVTSLCSFGAFVDLGGADGLIHLSELSWRRIRHPREVAKVGDKVEVYVLRLDVEKKRIGLSLKRLQPEPWSLIEEKYELGQLVEGVVTNVVDFGAFAEIEEGVEGLVHVSELADAQVSHPKDVVKKGDLLLLRIIRIDTRRKRLGLSLKRVLESEWAEWAARLAVAEAEKVATEAAEAAEVAAAEAAAEAAAAEVAEAVVEAEEVLEEAAAAEVAEQVVEAEEVLEEAAAAEVAEQVVEAEEALEEVGEEAAADAVVEAEEVLEEAVEEAADAVVEAEAVPEEAVEEAAEAVIEAEEVLEEAVEETAEEAVIEAEEVLEEVAAEEAAEAVIEAEEALEEAAAEEVAEVLVEAEEVLEEVVAEAAEEAVVEAEEALEPATLEDVEIVLDEADGDEATS